MKTWLLMSCLWASFVLCCGCGTASYLSENKNETTVNVYTNSGEMTPIGIHGSYRNDISIKAVRHFEHHYGEFENAKWFTKSNGNLVCIRSSDNHDVMVTYSKKGKWISSVQGYTKEKMSSELKAIVNQAYRDIVIEYVSEIEAKDNTKGPVYYIRTRQKNGIKILRVYGDEIETLP